jgi:hypothetical protein
MRRFKHQFFAAIVLTGFSVHVCSQVVPAQSRGELLYSTHCVTCHTTQMHWRNDRQAYDWESLSTQVRRWQANTGLAWSDADITEVARYLNETIYRYPQPNNRAGLTKKGQ